VDLRLIRAIPMAQVRLEAILDVFNLFNRSNVLDVQNTLASTTPPYGTPVAYGPMRQFQFGVKVLF
jgi:hypothetical protein